MLLECFLSIDQKEASLSCHQVCVRIVICFQLSIIFVLIWYLGVKKSTQQITFFAVDVTNSEIMVVEILGASGEIQ